MSPPDPALVEWLRYLREMGVRELRVPIDPLAAPFAEPGHGSVRGAAVPARGGVGERGASSSGAERGVERGRAEQEPRSPERPPRVGTAAEFERNHDAGPVPLASPAGHGSLLDVGGTLEEIRSTLGECTRCKLHRGRTQIVFGVGDPAARLMFVGEGPGAEEDRRGEPFVGRAGQKLDEMIRAIGLTRSQVYIANVVKCRPPDNRDPEPDEVATCSPFLFAQIEAIRPRVIVTLGLPAARTLLGLRSGIGAARGRWHGFRGIPVMPTFHPAYLLRAYTVENRRMVWEDLQAARRKLDEA